MDIKEFKYAWRYTGENYALFSSEQLSEMEVLDEIKANKIWNSVCDNGIVQESSYIQMMINRKLPILIGDCGWGDESAENKTREKLMSVFENFTPGKLTVLYDHNSAINISIPFLQEMVGFLLSIGCASYC